MGGPGVEWTSAGWRAPSPQPLTPSRPRDPGFLWKPGSSLVRWASGSGRHGDCTRPDHDLRPEGRRHRPRRVPDGRRRCACDLNTANRGGSDPTSRPRCPMGWSFLMWRRTDASAKRPLGSLAEWPLRRTAGVLRFRSPPLNTNEYGCVWFRAAERLGPVLTQPRVKLLFG